MISRQCGFGREMQGSLAQSVSVVHPAATGDVVKGCLGSSSQPRKYLLHHPSAQKASRLRWGEWLQGSGAAVG